MSRTITPYLNPPFRADHVGSLKRPTALLKARAAFERGDCSLEELRGVEDTAIRAIVDLQRATGIRSITDGEFRRRMFFDGVFDKLEGFKLVPDLPAHKFMDYLPDHAGLNRLERNGANTHICEGKIRRTESFYKDQFLYLKSIVSAEELSGVKITMCAPEWFHLRHGPYAYPTDVYATDDAYFADIAAAYRAEIAELYTLGCRNIQIDDPILAYFCDEGMLAGMQRAGVDAATMLDLYVRVYNDCLRDKPADMVAGLHLCRGNFKNGKHFSEGGYDRIAIKLFNEIDVECYYLEYDTERAGTFEPLKHLPPNKTVVLGIISSKVPALEPVADLKARIYAAADTIANGTHKRTREAALNQICISPQCGFASHVEGNPVTEEDMHRKLALTSEVARQVWTV